jgi:hypothetical protein
MQWSVPRSFVGVLPGAVLISIAIGHASKAMRWVNVVGLDR